MEDKTMQSGQHRVVKLRDMVGEIKETLGHQAAARGPHKRTILTPGNPDDLYPVPSAQKFVDEDAEYLHAPDLQEIGEAIIDKMGGFGYLAGLNLVFLWKDKGGKSHGKAILGRCQRPKGLLAKFCAADFIIVLSADNHRLFKSTRYQVEACVFHELCHTDLDNSEDIPEPRLVPHDYEGFCREVELYGAWRPDLEKAAKAFEQLKLGV